MIRRLTAPGLQKMRDEARPIVCLTAYDVVSARLAAEAEVDVVLVGDSVGNVVLGFDSTVPVDMEDILWCLRPVVRTPGTALIVADLPFGSYQAGVDAAVENAVRLMKAGAGAVKLEGPYIEAVMAMTRAGIPVMGHLGMTPQSVNAFGGHKVQGRGDRGTEMVQEARDLEEAGAFAVVLELMPAALASEITAAVSIPTIGIGAGSGCSGQIQVFHDVVGLAEKQYRHAARNAEGGQVFREALAQYARDVRSGAFPTPENEF